MKKISNEVKVGVTTILTIIVFIWLYNFLKGKDFFSNSAYYYTVYDKIGGLAESSPVEINGYKVGVVQSIDFVNPESGRLLVSFSVSKDFKLPKNTYAEIVPVSLLGGMKVQFVYGNGPGIYEDGDTIPGRLAASVMDKVETELLPLKDKISNLLIVLDSVITSVDDLMDPEFRKNIAGTVAHLNGTTESLDNILSSREKELKATLDNVNKFTKMLSDNSASMGKTFDNLEAITDTLAAADIYTSVSKLKESLEKTSILIDNLNNGKGSAGQFMTNDTLYTNLTNSLESLNVLLLDMKENPKRYVHFSLFGKKNIPPK
ncbi:MAG: MCE family protein [Bacteroidales bacterium]|nr:MCE family protein [Bacteroidales bacterium]MBK7627550.1 MCE family protein [Bacteroidales bacterium]